MASFHANAVRLALALAACSCHGETATPVIDASLDATPDAARPDRCPAGEPPGGESCYEGNFIGLSCAYGGDVCTCLNEGQNSARWSCSGAFDGAGPADGGVADGDAAAPDCVYDDGGSQIDAAGRFRGSCAGGCPSGTICAVEIGGVAGGGGEYCAPIVDRCRNDLSCACLASCVCGSSYGRAERCATATSDGGEVLQCDNGIR